MPVVKTTPDTFGKKLLAFTDRLDGAARGDSPVVGVALALQREINELREDFEETAAFGSGVPAADATIRLLLAAQLETVATLITRAEVFAEVGENQHAYELGAMKAEGRAIGALRVLHALIDALPAFGVGPWRR